MKRLSWVAIVLLVSAVLASCSTGETTFTSFNGVESFPEPLPAPYRVGTVMPRDTDRSVVAGELLEITDTVWNDGLRADEFDIRVRWQGEDWLAPSTNLPTSVYLEPQEQLTLTVWVQVPQNAQPGATTLLMVSVIPQSSPLSIGGTQTELTIDG